MKTKHDRMTENPPARQAVRLRQGDFSCSIRGIIRAGMGKSEEDSHLDIGRIMD